MIVAVTTPTGTVGGKVAALLLDVEGVQVKLLVRDRLKVRHFEKFGAVVHEGDLEDELFVTRATRVADALFWVTPTPPVTEDLREFQNRLGANAARAIATNRIKRVVNLSSFGAHLGYNTGPIDGLHDVEWLLDQAAAETGATITHLRPAMFMENYLLFARPIVEDGTIPVPMAGDRRIPMVATIDVAIEAIRQLVFPPSDDGMLTRPIHGPHDLTMKSAARTIGEVLGSAVSHSRTDPDETRRLLLTLGISNEVAAEMVQMFRAIDNGHLQPEHPRTAESTTQTSFRCFCEAVLAPRLQREIEQISVS